MLASFMKDDRRFLPWVHCLLIKLDNLVNTHLPYVRGRLSHQQVQHRI